MFFSNANSGAWTPDHHQSLITIFRVPGVRCSATPHEQSLITLEAALHENRERVCLQPESPWGSRAVKRAGRRLRTVIARCKCRTKSDTGAIVFTSDQAHRHLSTERRLGSDRRIPVVRIFFAASMAICTSYRQATRGQSGVFCRDLCDSFIAMSNARYLPLLTSFVRRFPPQHSL
jgi:hypothetical protein